MSITEEPQQDTPTTGGSLRDRIAQRRLELQQERSFVLPISGYEDLLAAHYRVMSYSEFRKIGRRHEAIANTTEGELTVFADTLINACLELLEIQDGDYVSTGKKWSVDAVRDLFGVDLPSDATVRQAVRQALTDTDLALHYRAYDLKADSVGPGVEDAVVGEAVAVSAAI